jgi:hypothetical protein
MSESTFARFYVDYLAEHRHPLNRALHLLAKLLALAALVLAVVERSVLLALAAPVLAVVPCWLGHLAFEGNRPLSWDAPAASLLGTLKSTLRRLVPGQRPHHARRATVRPYYSFVADLRMCAEMLSPRRARSSSNPST